MHALLPSCFAYRWLTLPLFHLPSQVLSLLLTLTGACSAQLASEGFDAPTTQARPPPARTLMRPNVVVCEEGGAASSFRAAVEIGPPHSRAS